MSKRNTRLSLWEAGNTLRPICLLEFAKEDATAKDGRASIEHVPPLKAGTPHIECSPARAVTATVARGSTMPR